MGSARLTALLQNAVVAIGMALEQGTFGAFGPPYQLVTNIAGTASGNGNMHNVLVAKVRDMCRVGIGVGCSNFCTTVANVSVSVGCSGSAVAADQQQAAG